MHHPGRDESRGVPSPVNLFRTRDLELPFFEGSLPSCRPHSAGYTCTFLHLYFPVANMMFVLSGELMIMLFVILHHQELLEQEVSLCLFCGILAAMVSSAW